MSRSESEYSRKVACNFEDVPNDPFDHRYVLFVKELPHLGFHINSHPYDRAISSRNIHGKAQPWLHLWSDTPQERDKVLALEKECKLNYPFAVAQFVGFGAPSPLYKILQGDDEVRNIFGEVHPQEVSTDILESAFMRAFLRYQKPILDVRVPLKNEAKQALSDIDQTHFEVYNTLVKKKHRLPLSKNLMVWLVSQGANRALELHPELAPE